MDRLTRNQCFLSNKRKTYSGLPLLHIPKRREKTKDNTEYIFPEDLEESFLQGELGGKHHTENGVPRHKQRTFSTVNQEQFHYLTDRYTSVNSDRSPVTNKFVFEKAYTRRKRDNYTTTKIDQTVPDSEALYHRDIQSEVNEDYSPFLDELDLEENIEYPDKTMGVVKTDNHVTEEMIEEFKHEYNGTQPKHANTEEIRSNLQTSINIKIRDANINHKGTNENPVANKEILKSNNQSFSSMFTKSDELSETCTKEKHKEVSSPWLTSRKQFDKKEPTENTATIQEPRQLWCYVNEDYLTDEQIQLPVDNNGAQFTTERDQQGLTKETDAKNETKLVKTDMEIEYKSKALTTNKYVKADMQIVRDGTPRISNTNKSFTETSHFPVPEQLEIKDNESNLSEQQSITDLHPGLATAKSHPLSNDYELQDDSDDYIPCSQMRTIRKPCQFIGTNLDTVAKDSGQLGAYAKESNTCSEVVSVPFSEDSDIVSGNQVIQEPSKMCQGKLFKSKLQETERYLSHNEIANLTGKLSKKTMYENSVSAKPACGPEIQYIKGLAFEYKVESRPNSLHFENQGIKVYDNTITPRVPVEDNSLDSTEDDMIIPPSGQSDETSMLQQVPDISRFLARKQNAGIQQE